MSYHPAVRSRVAVALMIAVGLAGAGLALHAPSASAANSAVSGTVRTANGAPVGRVRVDAVFGGVVVASQSTDGGGRYGFVSIPEGSVDLRLTLPANGVVPGAPTITSTITVAGPTTADLQYTPSTPIGWGTLTWNGAAAANGSTATFGGASYAVGAGADARITSAPNTPLAGTSVASNSNGAFSLPVPPSANLVAQSVRFNATTGDHAFYGVRYTPSAVAADQNMDVAFNALDMPVELVNPDGTPGTGYVEIDNFLNANPPVTGGDYFRFTGTVVGTTTVHPLSTASTAKYIVRSAPGSTAEPLAVGLFAPSSAPLVINLKALVTGRVLANGSPAGSSLILSGTTWSVAGGVGFRTGGTTINSLSTGLNPTTGQFSRRVPAGSYAISAALNLTGTAGPGAGSTMYFQRLFPEGPISGDRALGDIDFVTAEQTVRVIDLATGTSPTTQIMVTNIPAAGPAGGGSFSNATRTGSGDLVFPVLAGTSGTVTVMDPVTSAPLASGAYSAGTITTIVLGGLANVVVGPGDSDGDGVSDVVEATAPNQDANADGIADYLQNFVASPLIAGTGQRVSIISLDRRPLSNVATLPISAAATPPPSGAAFPIGFVKFSLPVPALSSTWIRLRVNPALLSSVTGYAKYNTTTATWSKLPGGRVLINRAGGWMDIRLTDNGVGDENPVPGLIADPGAPMSGRFRPACVKSRDRRDRCDGQMDEGDDDHGSDRDDD